jgi:hypothetical protein
MDNERLSQSVLFNVYLRSSGGKEGRHLNLLSATPRMPPDAFQFRKLITGEDAGPIVARSPS